MDTSLVSLGGVTSGLRRRSLSTGPQTLVSSVAVSRMRKGRRGFPRRPFHLPTTPSLAVAGADPPIVVVVQRRHPRQHLLPLCGRQGAPVGGGVRRQEGVGLRDRL